MVTFIFRFFGNFAERRAYFPSYAEASADKEERSCGRPLSAAKLIQIPF